MKYKKAIKTGFLGLHVDEEGVKSLIEEEYPSRIQAKEAAFSYKDNDGDPFFDTHNYKKDWILYNPCKFKPTPVDFHGYYIDNVLYKSVSNRASFKEFIDKTTEFNKEYTELSPEERLLESLNK